MTGVQTCALPIYGHSRGFVFKGAQEAAADYMTGKQTPLSVAFGMAVEDGFIS